MDSLLSLLSMETSGVVDAEAMVKGVVPIVLYFSSVIFLRGSLWAKLGYLQDISAHFPNRVTTPFYRVIACQSVRAPLASQSPRYG